MSEKPLLEEIEEFLNRDDVKLSETAFGKAAVNDGKLIKELRKGRNGERARRLWPETADRVRDFMAKHSEGAA